MIMMNEESIREMMQAIVAFQYVLSTTTTEIMDATDTCIENMQEDQTILKAREKIAECVNGFQHVMDETDNVLNGLQRELDRIEELKRIQFD